MAKRKTSAKNGPHPVDLHVGTTIRTLRLDRDLSQETLGKSVEVSHQQIQKYETAANRVSARCSTRSL